MSFQTRMVFFLQWDKKADARHISLVGSKWMVIYIVILQPWCVVISDLTKENQKKSYGFGMAWEWVNDRFYISEELIIALWGKKKIYIYIKLQK